MSFLAAIGLTIGVAAALIFVRSLATLLFGVKPLDPATFTAAAAALATLALAASLAPAIVATRSNPATTLRQE